jgi:hypothetical protein
MLDVENGLDRTHGWLGMNWAGTAVQTKRSARKEAGVVCSRCEGVCSLNAAARLPLQQLARPPVRPPVGAAARVSTVRDNPAAAALAPLESPLARSSQVAAARVGAAAQRQRPRPPHCQRGVCGCCCSSCLRRLNAASSSLPALSCCSRQLPGNVRQLAYCPVKVVYEFINSQAWAGWHDARRHDGG